MTQCPNYRVAVELVFLHDGKILLTKRTPKSKWGVPSGKVKYEETPVEAVFREAKEETNLGIEIVHQLDVRAIQFHKCDEKVYRLVFTYLVKPKNDNIAHLLLNDEHCDYVWVAAAELNRGNYSLEHDNLLNLLLTTSPRTRGLLHGPWAQS
jgi:8-oxo-dGTP diphosphatase